MSAEPVNDPLSDALLLHRLATVEDQFQAPGGVDLMTMSEFLAPGQFRAYLALTREWRARRRQRFGAA